MPKIYFHDTDAPPSEGRLYSEAVKVGNQIYLAGQVAVNSKGEIVGKGDIEAQTRQVMENMKRRLASAGASLKDVVKITIFLTKLEDRPLFHKVRAEYFGRGDDLPASTLVVVNSLANRDYLVEVEVTAVLG